MLVYLGICAVLAFLAALLAVLPAPTFSIGWVSLANVPAAAVHIAFAAGVMPLIFGAIIHFVPVLTRTAAPGKVMYFLPLLVQCAGLLTPLALGGGIPYAALHLAATMVSLAAIIVTIWIRRRLRSTLGAPHPGARWYGAALLCLFFAVSLVPVWLALPELRQLLRLFHLHLNTLGFIGLAALGTLPVLLPTACGGMDGSAASRLRQDLLPAAGGVLLIGAGASGGFWLGLPGALLLMWVLARNLRAWHQAFGVFRLLRDAATAPFIGALFGVLVLIGAGILHGMTWMEARPSIIGFAVAFLMPLVTGALAQLLPVWQYPGPDSPQRRRMREVLVWGGEWRALLFLCSGMAFIFNADLGAWPLALGLLWFLALLVAAFLLDMVKATDDNPAP